MMELRIADALADSFARLTGEVEKGIKTTALNLPRDPRLCCLRDAAMNVAH